MMIVSVAMLVVLDVDMATGGNEASFDYGKKSTFLYFKKISLPMVKFFAAYVYLYL